MYKKQSKQIGMSDFNMPLGMKLDPKNRWVQKAKVIPWDAIEQLYAENFKGIKGNVAKPLRLALGSLLIQMERKISDQELTLQIQESPYLQYFCGLHEYKDELPFDPSLMVYFRKRLPIETILEINEKVIYKALNPDEESDSDKSNSDKDDDNSDGGAKTEEELPNEGDIIIDATCAPQNIRYPQDASLLNEARENLESMIDELHDIADGKKPRTYRKEARKDYLKFAKSKKKTMKQIRKAIGRQLGYVRRDLEIVANYLANGRELDEKRLERLRTIQEAYEQQLHMHSNKVNHVENRIVSLSQPWVHPIVRGKAKAKCEFGAKLDISVAEGGLVRLEHTSFNAYNESGNFIDIVERYRERNGYYPERALVDKIYRTRENIAYCNSHGIEITGVPLGRPRINEPVDKKKIRQSEIDRIEVERKFSHAKGSYGLGLIRTKLKNTSQTAIALTILALNIALIVRFFRSLFYELLKSVYEPMKWMQNLLKPKNVCFVQ